MAKSTKTLITIDKEIYTPVFNEEDDTYIDMCPYVPYQRKCIEYTCSCRAGASFFNKGAEMMKEAQMIPPSETKKYEEAYNLAVAELKKSVPYLEKAKEINPKDKATLTSLKTLYLQTKENEKAMAIIDEIKALEAE